MRYRAIALLIVAILILSACSQTGISREEFNSLNAKVDTLSNQVETLIALSGTTESAEETQDPAQTPTPDFKNALLLLSDKEKVRDLFPKDFVNPFPEESLSKSVIFIENDQVQYYIIYNNQQVSQQNAEFVSQKVNGQIVADDDLLGGNPGWIVNTNDYTYTLQNLDPDSWYNGYIKGDEPAAAIGLKFDQGIAPDLSFWFDSFLFDYSSYPMHQALNDLLPPTTTVFSTDGNLITAGSHWAGFSQDEIRPIFEYYTDLLKNNDWFTLQGDVSDGAFLYAKLDEQRAISVNTMDKFEGYELIINIFHSVE